MVARNVTRYLSWLKFKQYSCAQALPALSNSHAFSLTYSHSYKHDQKEIKIEVKSQKHQEQLTYVNGKSCRNLRTKFTTVPRTGLIAHR